MCAASLSVRETIAACTRLFEEKRVDAPRLSAEILLAKALGMERNELLKRLVLDPGLQCTEEQLGRAEGYAQRRARGEPAAYILGVKEFYGRDFSVTPAVLIPRPETELVVDLALDFLRTQGSAFSDGAASGPLLFADFGTGSGCIGITLALARPQWRGLALDISAEALAVAQKNARIHQAGNLAFVRADFSFAPLPPASLRLLAANPPYVSEAEYQKLDPEVRSFEPRSALVPGSSRTGGKDAAPGPASGLEDALNIIAEAQLLLVPGGLLLMEFGRDQAKELLSALSNGPWAKVSVHKDMAGHNRVLAAQKIV